MNTRLLLHQKHIRIGMCAQHAQDAQDLDKNSHRNKMLTRTERGMPIFVSQLPSKQLR